MTARFSPEQSAVSLCEGARGRGRYPSRYRSPAFRGAVWAGDRKVELLVISW